MAKCDDDSGLPRELARGFDSLFHGLSGVMKLAADLVDKTDGPAEVSRNGSFGIPDTLRAAYGVSVRVGPARCPTFRRPPSIRREPRPSSAEDFREPNTDVFDEGDHYVVVAELQGVNESAVQWEVHGEVLVIRADCGDRHYSKQIVLPSAVKPDNVGFKFVNGIAELQLWKR
jgi:HSP20 family protein